MRKLEDHVEIDDGQAEQVVEVMSNPAGQLAERLQFLRLAKLLPMLVDQAVSCAAGLTACATGSAKWRARP
jgi:hypothetical protein